jgi:hypothetical protein
MNEQKLFMLLLGATPTGRLTEQHDIFFGIASSLKELVPAIRESWPEAARDLHIDAYREVTSVNGYKISVRPKTQDAPSGHKLFFLNLGGYQPGEFDEFHYKVLVPAESSSEAIRYAKTTVFYKQMGFKGAPSHIDEKYGLDVDNFYNVDDILPAVFKEKYELLVEQEEVEAPQDDIHLGYFQLHKL